MSASFGIDLSDFAECIYSCLRVAAVFVEQAEVVPDVRIFGIGFGRIFENLFGFVDLAGVYQRNAFVNRWQSRTVGQAPQRR